MEEKPFGFGGHGWDWTAEPSALEEIPKGISLNEEILKNLFSAFLSIFRGEIAFAGSWGTIWGFIFVWRLKSGQWIAPTLTG